MKAYFTDRNGILFRGRIESIFSGDRSRLKAYYFAAIGTESEAYSGAELKSYLAAFWGRLEAYSRPYKSPVSRQVDGVSVASKYAFRPARNRLLLRAISPKKLPNRPRLGAELGPQFGPNRRNIGYAVATEIGFRVSPEIGFRFGPPFISCRWEG